MTKSEKKAHQLQRRRFRAGRWLAKGVAQAEVARRAKVSRATVCEWNARLRPRRFPAMAGGQCPPNADRGPGLRSRSVVEFGRAALDRSFLPAASSAPAPRTAHACA